MRYVLFITYKLIHFLDNIFLLCMRLRYFYEYLYDFMVYLMKQPIIIIIIFKIVEYTLHINRNMPLK